MAVVCDADGERLNRSASLPPVNAFTICGWARLASAFSTDQVVALLSKSDGAENHGIGHLSGIGWCVFNSTDPPTTFSTTPGAGEWFFWALMADGSTITGHYARVTDAAIETITETFRTFTPFDLSVGSDFAGGGTTDFKGRIAAVKVWDAALSTAEVAQERWTIVPKRMANINLWSPLFLTGKDLSGNGRDWTENGALTWEDGPPIGWGATPQIPGVPAAAAAPIWLPGYFV